MKAWENYAMIKDGEVKNVCAFAVGSYTEAQHIASAVYGDGAFGIDVTYIPCQIGDTYENGTFYHDGEAITPMPDEEAQLNEHSAAIDDLTIAILEG